MIRHLIPRDTLMFFIKVVDILFQIYFVLLFLRILASWVPEFQNYRITQFIIFYTDPYLNLFRRIIPPIGMIDISPIIAFLALGFIEKIVKYLLINLLLK